MIRFLTALSLLSTPVLAAGLGWLDHRNADRQLKTDERQERIMQMAFFSDQARTALSDCSYTSLNFAAEAARNLAATEAVEKADTWLNFFAEVEGEYDNKCRPAMGVQETQLAVRAVDPLENTEAGDQRAQEAAEADAPPPPLQRTANASLRAEEAETPDGGNGDAGGSDVPPVSHAVLASYRIGSEESFAAERFAELSEQIAAYKSARRAEGADPLDGLAVGAFKTRISRHIALSIPAGDAKAAREFVRIARGQGWAPDAFVQDDRDWRACAGPVTIESLAAC